MTWIFFYRKAPGKPSDMVPEWLSTGAWRPTA